MRTIRSLLLTLVLGAGLAVPVSGQANTGTADSLFYRLASAQRAKVTRAELERSLAEIETVLASSGYSAELRARKQAEAAIIRQRLASGDIRPGDVILLAVVDAAAISRAYQVSVDTTVFIPTAGEVKLAGLLRSEVEEYLRKELDRYYVDPVVRADAQIRLGIFGGVNKQSFFITSTTAILPDVIMTNGGGPAGNYQQEKSEIRRKNEVIVDREAFVAAIREGRSLDELGLQSGDEIHIGAKRSGRLPILAALSTVASLSYLIIRIF